jgi:hypothetical protein
MQMLLLLIAVGVSGCVAGVPLALWRYKKCKDELGAAGYVKDRNLTIHEVACLGRKPNPDGTCSDETIKN